jgi:hypothetical protein
MPAVLPNDAVSASYAGRGSKLNDVPLLKIRS